MMGAATDGQSGLAGVWPRIRGLVAAPIANGAADADSKLAGQRAAAERTGETLAACTSRRRATRDGRSRNGREGEAEEATGADAASRARPAEQVLVNHRSWRMASSDAASESELDRLWDLTFVAPRRRNGRGD
jgi:hypothetical protein